MICHRDGMEFLLDIETFRRSLHEGDAIRHYRCPMGHAWPEPIPGSLVDPHARPHPEVRKLASKPCAVCGTPILLRGWGHSRVVCGRTCRKFVEAERAKLIRSGTPFRITSQPWYRGPGAEQPKVSPPDIGYKPQCVIPQAWWEGYVRVHALEA